MSEQILLWARKALVPLLWRLCCYACQFRPCRAIQPFWARGTPKSEFRSWIMQTDPRLRHEITHLLHFFLSHGQKIWTVNAWIHCKNTILLPPPPPNLLMLSGTTYFTLMLWIERWLGAGVRGNGSEKKNGGESVEPYLSEIISSAVRVHFLKSVPPQWSGLLSLVPPLCFALISAVRFYDIRTEQYEVYHTYLAALKSSSYSAFVGAKINLRSDSWNATR